MKKIIASVICLVLIAGVFIIDSKDLLSNKAYAAEEAKPSVEVYGNAKIEVEPDVAYINIGVNTEKKDASIAQKENKEKMNKIISSLKENGLTDEDLQTLNYTIRKNYRYLKDNEREEYYLVSNTLKVTLTDISSVGNIIDVASDSGANKINSIQFAVLDDNEYYNNALSLAMKNAEKKAEAILKTFDKEVSTPQSVIEISNNYGSVRNYENVMLESKASYDSTTPIQTGDITINARVKVIYNY